MDCYVRISSRRTRTFNVPSDAHDLLFVDVERGMSVSELRHAPHETFRSRSLAGILVRDGNHLPGRAGLLRRLLNRSSPGASSADVAALVQRIGLVAPSGVLLQPVAHEATIDGDLGAGDVSELLHRARAVELEAMLEWGNAIWRPEGYHYRLPSGEHAAEFVRMADAIRHPRDAEVIASWMHADLADGAGIVIDTGTLSAVAEALRSAALVAGFSPGPMAVLDGYPATGLEVRRAVQVAARRRRVLAVLSVSSTGSVASRLVDAMEALGQHAVDGRLAILISKRPVTQVDEQPADNVRISTWLPRPHEAPPATSGADGPEGCRLCRDPTTARVVPIDPVSFDGTLDLAHRTITPSVADADANRVLWEHLNACDAVRLEAQPHPAVSPFRPTREPMAIRIDHSRLLVDSAFRRDAVVALERAIGGGHGASADLLLVPEHERTLDGLDQLVEDMHRLIGSPRIASFPLLGHWPPSLLELVRASGQIAILNLGTVTGSALQQGLVAVQAERRPGPLLTGYVLHARLAERRAWETLQNSYGHRLYAAWESFLPDRSPLREEQLALEQVPIGELSNEALDYREQRLLVCNGDLGSPSVGVFWGSRRDDAVSPNSIFGQGLRGVALYTAVGAAMERARKAAEKLRTAPERRVFDLASIARSYYDPLILSAIVRWVLPHEAWWGWHHKDAEEVVLGMLERSRRAGEEHHVRVLVPELLLAGAQGKVPASGLRAAAAVAHSVLDQLDGEDRGPVELALAAAHTAVGATRFPAEPDGADVDQSRIV